MKIGTAMRLINFWPPFIGAGIRVKSCSKDIRTIRVEMKARFWNKNYVGVHFGGSLFAMTDPFYMIMLVANLGRDYIVWDKSASITYKKPGVGKVHALFELSEETINAIRSQADAQGKTEPEFFIKIMDETGDVVAEVEKLLYVKRKKTKTNGDFAKVQDKD